MSRLDTQVGNIKDTDYFFVLLWNCLMNRGNSRFELHNLIKKNPP